MPDEGNIEGFFAEVAAQGVVISEALTDKFWGDREFSMQDSDVYCLAFAQPKHDVSIEEAQDISAQSYIQPLRADD